MASRVDAATAVLTVQLGFHVRPGGTFPAGVANRIVSSRDRSYLELLFFTRAKRELRGPALSAYEFVEASGGGANGLALAVDHVDAVAAHLSVRGFALNDPDPPTYDPDGEGPRPAVANAWRAVTFKEPPLATADIFFIRYERAPRSAEQAGDMAALSRHPNGSNAISAVWLLSADVAEDRKRLEQMGFRSAGTVEIPSIKARGLRYSNRAGRYSCCNRTAAVPRRMP